MVANIISKKTIALLKQLLKPFVVRSIRMKNIVDVFSKSLNWITMFSSDGVFISNKQQIPYPEVTGYFIPTLRQWGEKKKAIKWAHWLVSIQQPNGAWLDPANTAAYTFDTGQILKGLISLLDECPHFETPILNGCEWVLGQVQPNGALTTPDQSQWQLPGGKVVPEAIHLYCLEPIKIVAIKYNKKEWLDTIDRVIDYYCHQPDIVDFKTLSHFHAYIIEALIDLGKIDLARQGMKIAEKQQRWSGAIPGYKNGRWVCSPGQFQYAVIWYKLGEIKLANKAFHYGCSLQEKSGGFKGSYGFLSRYCRDQEISWSIKYFMDALYLKIQSSFDGDVHHFSETIDVNDGRVKLLIELIKQHDPKKVLDVGCGKGRYLRHLIDLNIDFLLYGMDVSSEMLSYCPKKVNLVEGSVLDLSFKESEFDFIYLIESLEHAVHLNGAFQELSRVLSTDGILFILDKNKSCLGSMLIDPWEQWFDTNTIQTALKGTGLFLIQTIENISYDAKGDGDGLFLGWVIKKHE